MEAARAAVEAARAAMADKNAGEESWKARKYGEDLRKEAREDGTICMIYNASGGAVSLVDYHEWSGRVGRSPYPTRLENGQWGVFFHSKFSSDSSSAALVFDMHLPGYYGTQWVFAWNRNNNAQSNQCHTEVLRSRYSWRGKQSGRKQPEEWQALNDKLNGGKSVHHVCSDGVHAYASIGNTNNPIFEATLTLQDTSESPFNFNLIFS